MLIRPKDFDNIFNSTNYNLEPIKITTSIDSLKNKNEIMQKLFGPIFNAYGIIEENLNL